MKPGFTLLEVLVAATIIAVLSGVSLVGYNRFQERQQLAAARDQLRNDLRLTQQKALAGEKPAGWCAASGQTLAGWRLEFITPPTTYEIKAVCSDGSVSQPDKTVILSGNAAKSAGNDYVDFVPLTGAATATASFTLQTNAASGNWRATVSVTDSGLIESSDISL